jgi:hypothetical protein
MIDHSHDLPIKRQAALVNISRGSAYYKASSIRCSRIGLREGQRHNIHMDEVGAISPTMKPSSERLPWLRS